MGRFVDQGPFLVAGIAKQGRRLILPKVVLKEIDFKDRIRRNGAIDGSNKSDGASQVMAPLARKICIPELSSDNCACDKTPRTFFLVFMTLHCLYTVDDGHSHRCLYCCFSST